MAPWPAARATRRAHWRLYRPPNWPRKTPAAGWAWAAAAPSAGHRPARQHLQQALALAPHLAQAQGERGTLETFSNRFYRRRNAFQTAGQDQRRLRCPHRPGPAAAQSKASPKRRSTPFARRRDGAALCPRQDLDRRRLLPARAPPGRHHHAAPGCRTGRQGPVPHMLLAQIHTDLFQPGEAVAAARAGAQRMPYLRSLNQLANDQKGSANLGAALAFFGMEDWALELAQQSFYPTGAAATCSWPTATRASSTELGPVPGLSHRPHGLWRQPALRLAVAAPGSHGAVGLTLDREFYRLASPALTLNGMDNRHVPVSWFVKAQTARALRFPVDVGWSTDPAVFRRFRQQQTWMHRCSPGVGRATQRAAESVCLRQPLQHRPARAEPVPNLTGQHPTQGAGGLSLPLGATEQTWIKLGAVWTMPRYLNYLRGYLGSAAGVLGLASRPRKQFNDLQLRHTFDSAPVPAGAPPGTCGREAVQQTLRAEGFISASTPQGVAVRRSPWRLAAPMPLTAAIRPSPWRAATATTPC